MLSYGFEQRNALLLGQLLNDKVAQGAVIDDGSQIGIRRIAEGLHERRFGLDGHDNALGLRFFMIADADKKIDRSGR